MIRSRRYRILGSHLLTIGFASLVLTWLEVSAATLFGVAPQESVSMSWSFYPESAFRASGLTFLTYPLVHLGWEHGAVNVALWFVLGGLLARRVPGLGLLKEFSLGALYALSAVLIALSYLSPMAPPWTAKDFILGLSGLVFFQWGFLIFMRPPVWVYGMAPIFLWILWTGSALSNWGHGVGLVLGMIYGLTARFRGTSGASSSRPSY